MRTRTGLPNAAVPYFLQPRWRIEKFHCLVLQLLTNLVRDSIKIKPTPQSIQTLARKNPVCTGWNDSLWKGYAIGCRLSRESWHEGIVYVQSRVARRGLATEFLYFLSSVHWTWVLQHDREALLYAPWAVSPPWVTLSFMKYRKIAPGLMHELRR